MITTITCSLTPPRTFTPHPSPRQRGAKIPFCILSFSTLEYPWLTIFITTEGASICESVANLFSIRVIRKIRG
jgi:hypothetical protein